MEKLGIVLATYNESLNLPPLIEALEALTLSQDLHVFVVDDNSPDGTSEIAVTLASRYGNISLITRPDKRGLGSALRDGMRAALAQNCSLITTMDADLSHDPQALPTLLEAAKQEDVNLVQGSRYVKGGSFVGLGPVRRFQSRLANLLCHWLLGLPLDSTSNFRVYSAHTAELMISSSKSNDYEFQPEAALIALSHGLRIVEVPIVFTSRATGASKLGLSQNLKWALFFLRAILTARRPFRSNSRTS